MGHRFSHAPVCTLTMHWMACPVSCECIAGGAQTWAFSSCSHWLSLYVAALPPTHAQVPCE